MSIENVTNQFAKIQAMSETIERQERKIDELNKLITKLIS
jgi:hypothetical protein